MTPGKKSDGIDEALRQFIREVVLEVLEQRGVLTRADFDEIVEHVREATGE